MTKSAKDAVCLWFDTTGLLQCSMWEPNLAGKFRGPGWMCEEAFLAKLHLTCVSEKALMVVLVEGPVVAWHLCIPGVVNAVW